MSHLVRLYPALLLVTLALLVVRRARGRPTRPRWLPIVIALLFLWSWPPVAWLLAGTLEWRYGVEPPAAAGAQAIVVLSGGALPAGPDRPVSILARDTYRRCRRAAWVWRQNEELPVVVSGGRLRASDPPSTLAGVMREFLEAEGVPSDRIWEEDRSRTTHENAVFTSELLRGRGISRAILVTEATHMVRAELCFRRQGTEVIPVPCDFHARPARFGPGDLLPGHDALEVSERTLHEWLGLAWYWIRGRI